MKSIGMMMMQMQKNKNIEMSRFANLSAFRGIFHFTTTRHGGASQGLYASMNPGLYTDDDPVSVRHNLALLSEAIGLPACNIIMPHQVHRDKILCVDRSFLMLKEREQIAALDGVDALITDQLNVCVSVCTADCVPILLYAPDRKVVAAIHAGWRGTVQHIVRKTLRYMFEAFSCDPGQMLAGIGPSISQSAFEVGEEVVEAFEKAGMPLSQIMYRDKDTQKAHVDLWEANRLQLASEGLLAEHIEVAGICTYSNSEDYFSARRLGIKSGRILSGIFIRE